MLYNEEEVIRICKKYGIETIEKEGYPIYMENEMDENFSFSEMMHQPVDYDDEDSIVVSSESITFSLPIYTEPSHYNNCYSSKCSNNIPYNKESDSRKTTSNIPYENKNKYAA